MGITYASVFHPQTLGLEKPNVLSKSFNQLKAGVKSPSNGAVYYAVQVRPSI